MIRVPADVRDSVSPLTRGLCPALNRRRRPGYEMCTWPGLGPRERVRVTGIQGVSGRSAGGASAARSSLQKPGAGSPAFLWALCSHELAGCQELWDHLWRSPWSLSHGLQGRGREEMGQGRGAGEVPTPGTTLEAAPWVPTGDFKFQKWRIHQGVSLPMEGAQEWRALP